MTKCKNCGKEITKDIILDYKTGKPITMPYYHTHNKKAYCWYEEDAYIVKFAEPSAPSEKVTR